MNFTAAASIDFAKTCFIRIEEIHISQFGFVREGGRERERFRSRFIFNLKFSTSNRGILQEH